MSATLNNKQDSVAKFVKQNQDQFCVNHQNIVAPKAEDVVQIKTYINFLTDELQYRQKSLHHHSQELLAKAIGHKNGKVFNILDATAGFGIDSFLLANLGHNVTMLERSPLIASYLEDALQTLCLDVNYQHLKLQLIHINAIDFMRNRIVQAKAKQYDIVYLDPMYPERNKTALNKQKMRLLKNIVGDDNDAEDLFNAAKQIAKNRVIVKRPRLANLINISTSNNKKHNPTFVINGKSCRYDVYQC